MNKTKGLEVTKQHEILEKSYLKSFFGTEM